MKPLPHHYHVRLTGGPAGYAELSTSGVPPLASAPPADYDGPGNAWSPEHLLLASVETCFLFTLRATAHASHLPFRLELDADGTVDRKEGVTRFSEIVLRPTLVVPAGTDRGQALRLLDKSTHRCLVSASLSTPIRVESEVKEQ